MYIHHDENLGEIESIISLQTEKSQPKGKWIMPEIRFTEFPALSVDPRVRVSWSAMH